MKLLIAAFVAIVCVDGISAILGMGQQIPANWPVSLISGGYVKDADNCRFGYRFNEDNQVIHILNCTNEDPTVFYALSLKVCARDSNTVGETCLNTPFIDEVDTSSAADPACVNVRAGVALDPSNCCRFLQCGENNGIRYGRRYCSRGQYFSPNSYRCEFMWSEGNDGTITPLGEEFMCGNRPIPAGRRRNTGIINDKCRNTINFDDSVSDPLNCQFYYSCSRWQPGFEDNSFVGRCNGNLYWSDSLQRCALTSDMPNEEVRACSLF